MKKNILAGIGVVKYVLKERKKERKKERS